MRARAVAVDNFDTAGTEGRDAHADQLGDLRLRQPGLLTQQTPLVLVGEQVGGAVDELPCLLTVESRELLRRVGGEWDAEASTFLGVPQHRCRIVGTDQYDLGCTDAFDDPAEIDLARLTHRSRIERRELRHRLVRGAHEASRVVRLGDAYSAAVDAVRLEPLAIVVKVRSHRSDEHRRLPQLAHRIRDVACDTAASDHEILDKEAERNVLEMIGENLLRELPRELHQMICRDGTTYNDCHVLSKPLSVCDGPPREPAFEMARRASRP